MLSTIKQRYKICGSDRTYIFSAAIAAVALMISGVVNYLAGVYSTEQASNAVTDIILSNTRVYNVDAIFVYGSFILIAFITFLLVIHPKRIPFALYTLSLFIVIRSSFVSMTHLGPFPTHAVLDLGNVASKFIFGGDLFFSGHTGIPFLMALLFWKNRVLRYIFLVWSVVFGTTALLGHLHYTIDVLSAFFITFTIFTMAEHFFKKERALFLSEER